MEKEYDIEGTIRFIFGVLVAIVAVAIFAFGVFVGLSINLIDLI